MEGVRLSHGVLIRLPRVARLESLQYGDMSIPPGVRPELHNPLLKKQSSLRNDANRRAPIDPSEHHILLCAHRCVAVPRADEVRPGPVVPSAAGRRQSEQVCRQFLQGQPAVSRHQVSCPHFSPPPSPEAHMLIMILSSQYGVRRDVLDDCEDRDAVRHEPL